MYSFCSSYVSVLNNFPVPSRGGSTSSRGQICSSIISSGSLPRNFTSTTGSLSESLISNPSSSNCSHSILPATLCPQVTNDGALRVPDLVGKDKKLWKRCSYLLIRMSSEHRRVLAVLLLRLLLYCSVRSFGPVSPGPSLYMYPLF
jgi:hypothetical protein